MRWRSCLRLLIGGFSGLLAALAVGDGRSMLPSPGEFTCYLGQKSAPFGSLGPISPAAAQSVRLFNQGRYADALEASRRNRTSGLDVEALWMEAAASAKLGRLESLLASWRREQPAVLLPLRGPLDARLGRSIVGRLFEQRWLTSREQIRGSGLDWAMASDAWPVVSQHETLAAFVIGEIDRHVSVSLRRTRVQEALRLHPKSARLTLVGMAASMGVEREGRDYRVAPDFAGAKTYSLRLLQLLGPTNLTLRAAAWQCYLAKDSAWRGHLNRYLELPGPSDAEKRAFAARFPS